MGPGFPLEMKRVGGGVIEVGKRWWFCLGSSFGWEWASHVRSASPLFPLEGGLSLLRLTRTSPAKGGT